MNKNFEIDEDIFNECQFVSPENIDDDILYQICANEIDDDEVTEDDIYDELSYIINVGIIDRDSLLARALITWFANVKQLEYHEMLDYLKFTEDDHNWYFTAGCGYNRYDSDILGGDGSGKTVKAFLTWLND